MKIAVNRCFGGFQLSSLAIKKYLELKGKKCFVYEQTKYSFRDGVDEYRKVDPKAASNAMGTHVLLKDYGGTIDEIPWDDDIVYYPDRDNQVFRTDPDLITVIEQLESAASGQCGDIKIVEIPDGVNWEIDSYDGRESIHEVHRSW